MSGNRIADFFAEIGIKVDADKLVQLDKKLDNLQRSLHNLEQDAKKSVGKAVKPFQNLNNAVKSSAASINKLTNAEAKLNKTSANSNKQLQTKAKHLSQIDKLQASIVKSPLSQSIGKANKQRAEYENFWKTANTGQKLVANKASEIMSGGAGRVAGIRNSKIDHVALARQAMVDRVLNNSYNTSLPRDRASSPRDGVRSNLDSLMNPMKELSKRAQGQAQRMYEEMFKSVDKNAGLKNQILGRMNSQNPAVAGKFGNLVFAENRLAKERTEQAAKEAKIKADTAAKAMADEKARQKYLQQAQAQYLRDMEKASKEAERSERTRLRLLEQQERVAQRKAAAESREYEKSRRRGEVARRQAYIDSRRDEVARSRMAAYERMGRGKVGRPSEFSFGPMAAAGSVKGGIAGFLPGFGLAYGLMNMNQINQQIQGQKSAMTSIMAQANPGSTPEQATKLGQDQIDWVEAMSNNLGTDSRSSVSSYSKMLQSGIEGGLGVGNVQNVFQGVSEYGRVMGLDQESMKGSFVAIEQMMNKGQIYSEELKTQLAERMPGVMSAMAQAGGFGTDDKAVSKLLDAMKDGKVKTKDVIEKFAKILSDRARAGGALEKAMNSSTAEQARYGNAITKFVEKFSAAGGETGFARIFKSLREAMEKNADVAEKLGKVFDKLTWLFKGVVGGAGELFSMFAKLGPMIGMSEEGFLTLAAVVAALMLPFGEFIVLGAGLLVVLDDLSRWADGNDSFFKDIFEGLTPETKQTLTDIAVAFKELGTNLLELAKISWKGWEELFNFWTDNGGAQSVLDRMRDMVQLLTNLTGALVAIGNADMAGALKALGKGADNVYNLGGLGAFNKEGNDQITARNREIVAAGNNSQTPQNVIDKFNSQNITKEDLIARINRQAEINSGPSRPTEIKFGDISISIQGSGDLSQMNEELGRQFGVMVKDMLSKTAAGIGEETQ